MDQRKMKFIILGVVLMKPFIGPRMQKKNLYSPQKGSVNPFRLFFIMIPNQIIFFTRV